MHLQPKRFNCLTIPIQVHVQYNVLGFGNYGIHVLFAELAVHLKTMMTVTITTSVMFLIDFSFSTTKGFGQDTTNVRLLKYTRI
jgi:hypothetical protein